MHLDGANPPDPKDVVATMRSYGLPVWVTEFDVNMSGTPESKDQIFARQAAIYSDAVRFAIESGVCRNFVIFQIVDKLSVWETIPQLPGYSLQAYPTPYDDDFQPKPAYYAVLDVLKNPPPVAP